MLRLTDVQLRRGPRIVLDRVDVELVTGELICLCGPNGAGKSSLIGLCAGDLEPTRGSVTLHGVSPSSHPVAALARLRAVMAQNPALTHPFRVIDVVALGSPGVGSRDCEQTLEELGCSALTRRVYTELSGGERRLVQLARVLLQAERACAGSTPAWLLLDEPVSQLDLGRSEAVMAALHARAARGFGVLTVMHDIELASRHADRMLVLGDNQIIADGDATTALTAATIHRAWQIAVRVEAETPGPGVRVRVLGSR